MDQRGHALLVDQRGHALLVDQWSTGIFTDLIQQWDFTFVVSYTCIVDLYNIRPKNKKCCSTNPLTLVNC